MDLRVPACILTFLLAGCLATEPSPEPEAQGTPAPSALSLERVASGFDAAILVTHDDTGALYVVEQGGMVWRLWPDGNRTPWLDLTGVVGQQGGEQGLLGLAFHPDGGSLYISYTDPAGTSVLAGSTYDGAGLQDHQFHMLLEVAQPFPNHNGGHIAFGPDGYLYYGLGDGGLAGDPNLNGQNRATLLGSILRLDVEADGYSIPPDNPFVGDPTAAEEIWAYGLRNPWRFSLDPETGDLWIGDVGQDAWEEMTRIPAGVAGANLGWNLYEGNHHYPTGLEAPLPIPGLLFPDFEVAQGPHCSITGGPVVHNETLSALDGKVVWSDFCSGYVWAMAADDSGEAEVLMETNMAVSSFGTGPDGAVYLVAYAEGAVYRFTQ